MVIPVVAGSEAILPAGRHRTDLAEIEAYFVSAAPFSTERQLVFDAFKTWMTLVDQLLPNSRYWIDGGFVTHKTWAAPSDVDVTILCQASAVDALTPAEQSRLDSLLTVPAAPGRARLQPMGGLVDAFLVTRASPDVPYWITQWSRVKGADGSEVRTITKGFLEVVM
jgi:hypothetical protein